MAEPEKFLSLDALRARVALQAITGMDLRDEDRDTFLSKVRACPTMVRRNGLVRTLAILEDDEKEGSRAVVRAVTEWFRNESCPVVLSNSLSGGNRLLPQLLTEDTRVWWRAQEEALAYMEWLKLLAESNA